ncbi:MAG: hypothetical protein J1F69_06250 [Clostridiales bacterium]|nr:hypothetical protein [Clostridiales bacterium]
MEYSDEHKDVIQNGKGANGEGVKANTDNNVMPKIVPVPSAKKPVEQPQDEPVKNSFAEELLSSMFKTIFVALSLIAMLACIFALAFPLESMRIFNSMGLDERAVDFGERYISRELKSHKSADGKRTAAYTDEQGNMSVLSRTSALTNDDFIEALYVCNSLSNKLMTENLKSGNTSKAEYYAKRLEKYTRMYLSLNGLSAVSLKSDAKNIRSVPAAVRPVVYSYEHDMHTLNYRARAVLGKTSGITYNNRSDRLGVMTSVAERSERFYGSTSDTPEGRIALIDEFVDYADQLGAYLDVEFIRIGVETNLEKKYTIKKDGNQITAPVLNEQVINYLYGNKVLKGNEFTLFIMPLQDVTENSNGFTRLYNLLSVFTRYAQWAVDTVPIGEDGVLHQLYWLRILSNVSRKLWYMEMIMYYNAGNLGYNADAVRKAYPTCENYMFVNYRLSNMTSETSCQLLEVYADKLKDYLGS